MTKPEWRINDEFRMSNGKIPFYHEDHEGHEVLRLDARSSRACRDLLRRAQHGERALARRA